MSPTGNQKLFPLDKSVVDFFREQVKSQPKTVAVQETGRILTYQDLDHASDLVAAELTLRGLKSEEAVMVLIPASGDFVTAILGILKAGGSYLPVDPEVPVKRLQALLKDCGNRFALTNASGTVRLSDWPVTALLLSQITSKPGVEPDWISNKPIAPHHRAYLVYTSGSTGQPNGVEIEHRSLTNLVCAYQDRFGLGAGDRSTMLANVAFDASVADVWPALCAGGTVVVPPRGIIQHPDSLISWLAQEKINWTFVPTGVAEILFGRPWPAQTALRILITGGDWLRLRPPPDLPFTVFNAYGPTENTVISTWSLLKPRDGSTQSPPIGSAIANVLAYVLDDDRQPVTGAQAGELYLGGEQVARGYFGKTALTAQRFFPDPFSGKKTRLYRTGDWVKWLPDGELEFLGRRDDQVQIRGSRVELGEIETILLLHPVVRQVCCLSQFENNQAIGIVAHVVPSKETSDFSSELRTYLASQLPHYMIPATFEFHQHLPLTSYGKIDRAALANSSVTKVLQPDDYGDGLAMALSRLWHALLPAAADSPKDATISNLGGDSLLVMKLILGVEEITNQRLEISTFLVQPTLPGLCQAVKTRMSQTEFQPVLTLRKQGDRPPLFCLYNYEGDIDVYFALAEALGIDQPVFGIRSPTLHDISRLPASMEAAATEVLACIRKIQPAGAPALVGYSWAGLLAFEVARQLAEKEGIACFTALVGAEAPIRPITLAMRLGHFATNLPPWFWHLLKDHENRWRRLSRLKKMAGRARENLAENHLPMKGWVSTPISSHMVALMEKYRPCKKSNVKVDLFRERHSYQSWAHPLHAWQTGNLEDGGWSRWTTSAPRVHWLDADHTNIIRRPQVQQLAKSIREAMDRRLNPGYSP